MHQGWHVWDASWDWSLLLIGLTLALHAAVAVGIGMSLIRLRRNHPEWRFLFHSVPGAVVIMTVVGLMLALLHGIECAVWALVYLVLGAIQSPSDALLYSVDSMVTRGSSGLTLASRWQMMGALEAADGTLLFSVSAALLFAMLQAVLPAIVARDRQS